MKKFFLLVLAAQLNWLPALACDCVYGGPFLQMSKETPLVALIKVKKYLTFKNIYDSKVPMSMEIEIIEVYKGKEARKTVVVWGDKGNLCRPYLSVFKEGGYYVIALDNGNPERGHPGEKDTDYSISACGCYWLNVNMKNKKATGDINSNNISTSTIDLHKLKKAIV